MSLRLRFSTLVAVSALLALSVGSASTTAAAPKRSGPVPTAGTAASFHVSPAARVVAARPPRPSQPRTAHPRHDPLAGQPDQGAGGTWDSGTIPADPLSGGSGAKSVAPPPFVSWNGTGNPAACGGCQPPDTTGDVGPSQYVQMVNSTKVAIYSKTGSLIIPIFDLGNLWSGTPSDPCYLNNDGDGIVLYDGRANRWLLSQFVVASNELCFAISQTPDPGGSYFLFRFTTSTTSGEFPDYFKVGVGPDAYFVGANETTYTAYAFDRTKMLAGNSTAGYVKFTGQTNFLMPADLDGPNAFVGTAGYFYTFKDNAFAAHGGGVDRIELFQLDPDFAVTANSTFIGPTAFPIAAFTYTPCGYFHLDCINQLGATATQRIDAIGEWPMHRLVYRNMGSYEAMAGVFTIGTAPNGPGGTGEVGAAQRWFELRRVGAGAWTLYQQGTYDPADGNDRFMGSIAMDGAGNIALGYSVSSSAIHPAIRYATRSPGDPLGTLGAEQVLINGAGSQLSGADRWGDYSSMTIDPGDDCTFWYTNEYYATSNSSSDWSTRIGAFRPDCPSGPTNFSVTDVGRAEGDSGTTAFTFTVRRNGSTTGTVTVDVRTNNGSATAPSDYTAIPVTTLSFAPGVRSRPVTVSVHGDLAVEPNETFAVDLSSPTGATISDGHGVGVITNDDSPTVRKPDGRIQVGGGAFAGDNIYNITTAGQTKTGSAPRGGTMTFGISVQNDGTGTDRFKLLGTGGAVTGYTVQFLDGATDVTASVMGGSYMTGFLAPGASRLITVLVKPRAAAAAGSMVKRVVYITSAADAGKKDAVQLIGQVQ